MRRQSASLRRSLPDREHGWRLSPRWSLPDGPLRGPYGARSLNLGSGRHPRFGEGVGKLPPCHFERSEAEARKLILQQRSVQQHGVVVGELEARIDSLERVDAHVIRDDESINHVELKIGRAVIGTIK